MGARAPNSAASNGAGSRLRREDFRRTKHDSAFSQWKILIGPSDWKHHSTAAKEREEKYKTQNLPKWTCCPGVYELGVASSCPLISGRGARKIRSRSVVTVYLGQAGNLRNRLQQYRREGAHLKSGWSNDCETGSSHKGLGLFADVFSRGLAILYRCAPTKSKEDAETTKRHLLNTFDYAWNEGGNGPRRPNDIHTKLHHLSTQSRFSLLVEKFASINKKPVGIKITPWEQKNRSSVSNTDGTNVFGGKRLQPGRYERSGDSSCGSVLKMNDAGNAVCPSVEFEDCFFRQVCGFCLEDCSLDL